MLGSVSTAPLPPQWQQGEVKGHAPRACLLPPPPTPARPPKTPTRCFLEVCTACLQCREVYQVDMLCGTMTAKAVELPSTYQTCLMEQQQGQAAARWVGKLP